MGVTRYSNGGVLQAVPAPLTPRPRGTIHEAMPFKFERFVAIHDEAPVPIAGFVSAFPVALTRACPALRAPSFTRASHRARHPSGWSNGDRELNSICLPGRSRAPPWYAQAELAATRKKVRTLFLVRINSIHAPAIFQPSMP